MARMTEAELQALGPWPSGANNLARETSVPSKSFRQGINIDVADDGKVSRREGYARIFAAVEPGSLFSSGSRFFFAAQDQLMAGEVDGPNISTPVSIYSGLATDVRLCHCLIEPDLYVSDGSSALRVSPSNEVTLWSLPQAPAPQAGISPDAGSLVRGVYLFGVTCRAANGEEGPISSYVKAEITSDLGSIALSLGPAPAGASRYVIYMTKPNGTELLRAASVPAVASTITFNRQRLGAGCPTDGLSEMPAGQFATYFGGRLLVAIDNQVVWSEPQHYGLTVLENNYTLLSERVTGLGSAGETTGGFYVGQESRTYFMRGGDPGDAGQEEVYPSGMVPYSMTMVPGARLPMDNPPTVPVPVWLATNGVFCAGLADGTVFPLTETRYTAAVGSEAASVFVQREGMNRLLVTTREPQTNVFAVGDSVSIEVVRNGITP